MPSFSNTNTSTETAKKWRAYIKVWKNISMEGIYAESGVDFYMRWNKPPSNHHEMSLRWRAQYFFSVVEEWKELKSLCFVMWVYVGNK